MQLEQERYRGADAEVGAEAATLAAALEVAAEASQHPVQGSEALRAVTQGAGAVPDWTELAASAAMALGLHPSVDDGPLAVPGLWRPALVRLGPQRWWVALGRRGRRVRVAQVDARGIVKTVVSSKKLVATVGDRPWLHLEPLLALAPIAKSHMPDVERRPWSRLRAFLSLERRELGVIVVYAIVIGALTLATPVAAQALVNTVALGAVLQPLVALTILLLAVLMFSGVLTVLESYVVEVVQRRVFTRVADDFGRRLPAVRLEQLDGVYGPEMVNRFFDVLTIQKSLAVLLLDGLALTLQTVIGLIVLAFYHPLLLAFDVVLVLVLLGVFVLGRGAVTTGLQESSAKYKTAAWLEDLARSPSLFRGRSSSRYASEQTHRLCRDYLAARRRHYRILLRQIAGGLGLQILAMVSLLGVGGWLVIERQLTLGQLVAGELIIAAVGSGFVKLGKNLEKVYDVTVGVQKVASVVDLEVERRGGERVAGVGPASLLVRDATIGCGTRFRLSGVNLELAPGDRVRLVGGSGCGKSTLLEVLSAHRVAQAGVVAVDGVELRRAELTSVRESVVLVRDAEFFLGTIRDNLDLGRVGRNVETWLSAVHLESVLDALPQGRETVLMPTGSPLSQTQARRLALARALAMEPRLLILDGALDGLGLESTEQAALLDRVLGPDAPWTLIVVTQDNAVAARCSRTLSIAQGRVIEQERA